MVLNSTVKYCAGTDQQQWFKGNVFSFGTEVPVFESYWFQRFQNMSESTIFYKIFEKSNSHFILVYFFSLVTLFSLSECTFIVLLDPKRIEPWIIYSVRVHLKNWNLQLFEQCSEGKYRYTHSKSSTLVIIFSDAFVAMECDYVSRSHRNINFQCPILRSYF